ncbi:predicted protein [Nematostella vectensis]|uniref:Thioredoxin domain-containing protein n=1 Tax=Nematostella vectensis TaxID=45351 RepID=A7SQL3_NEMVE|nr:thioredoxin domain-containing protein 15 [Nematostella vectensis]EDO34022.1 predicted protein [Nematostella vectensis]|eukprot:XP_001626122.1 predicted protein [Nematostella vectensis]
MADIRKVFFVVFICFGVIHSQDTDKTPGSESVSESPENEIPLGEISSDIEAASATTEKSNIAQSLYETVDENRTITNELGVNATESIAVNQTDSNQTSTTEVPPPKWLCAGRTMPEEFSNRVIIVNESSLLQWVNSTGNTTDGCAVVLFYTRFCVFSAKLAPMFNAFGRAYNNTPVLALDAYQHNSMNARLGVVATPTILIFHAGKPVLKFNHSQTLHDLRTFVKNHTGLEGNSSIEVSTEDYDGPVSSITIKEPNYYLAISSLFLLFYGLFVFSQSNYSLQMWLRLNADWVRMSQWIKPKTD